MSEAKKTKSEKSFRLIPEYREEIDVGKICQALIMAAKEMPGKTGKDEDNNK